MAAYAAMVGDDPVDHLGRHPAIDDARDLGAGVLGVRREQWLVRLGVSDLEADVLQRAVDARRAVVMLARLHRHGESIGAGDRRHLVHEGAMRRVAMQLGQQLAAMVLVDVEVTHLSSLLSLVSTRMMRK